MPAGQFAVVGAEAMERLGCDLGRTAFAGLVVGLCGPLGAGKTLLVRGIAQGLDIPNPLVVSSPTFVLIQEYRARLTIHHFDVYRLPSAASFAELGPEEYFADDGICLIEWADRVESQMPESWLKVRIAHTATDEGTSARLIEWSWIGETPSASAALLGVLQRASE